VKQRSGFYPRPDVDAAGSRVVSQAGAVALTETIRAVGFGPGIVRGAVAVAQAGYVCRTPGDPGVAVHRSASCRWSPATRPGVLGTLSTSSDRCHPALRTPTR
jgi:hypothetical protein